MRLVVNHYDNFSYNFIKYIIYSTCGISTLGVYLLVNIIFDYFIDVKCCDKIVS